MACNHQPAPVQPRRRNSCLTVTLLSLTAVLVSAASAEPPAAPLPGVTTDVDTVIAYDTGNRGTWWTSDRDSFGAGVLFTPSEYPCEILGARAEINYDDGQQIYLRVWDDDGPDGLPGTILYNEQRLDIPPSRTPGFRDYDLTEPVRIDSGDFYIVFWQKNIWDMQFSSDERLDSTDRQWWYFPDQGWVTPYGGNPGDHLIRARVRYGTGVVELLGPPVRGRMELRPNPTTDGRVELVRGRFSNVPATVTIHDALGRARWSADLPGTDRERTALDISSLAAGVYLVRVRTATDATELKLVVRNR